MQNAAVFTAADNGVIGRVTRTVAVKFVVNFAFQMVLEHPRRHFSIARVCAVAVISPARRSTAISSGDLNRRISWTMGRQSIIVAGAVRFCREPLRSFSSALFTISSAYAYSP